MVAGQVRKRGELTEEGHGRHRHAYQDSRVQEGPGKQVEDGKGGKLRDKQWRPACGDDVQTDGKYAPGRVCREKQVEQRE